MEKKPRKVDRTVVGTPADSGAFRPQPPRKLGKHGLAAWNSLQTEFHITDAGGVELLAQICAARCVDGVGDANSAEPSPRISRSGRFAPAS
jgi:hypothetical protein